ncbi:CASP-like protein 4A2 isoform X1 [Zingiber officinale]|uniref:CASP-like protein 4A2 isoform X1 n=1 Tax=Zingiber officinale TaxID=94328 RepID=UPI001C4DBADE|nr:CASP-like protein 4A2 isoform X1 [Zingiber officinale]
MTSPRKSPASPLAPNTLTPGRGDALPPVKGTLGEEPTPESSLALVVNSLDVRKEAETVASDGGIRTRERGFAPTSLERTRRLEETAPPRKKALWLRMAALLLCMISFSVMVTDKTDGWAGDSFHRYKEFRGWLRRYLVAVNVIGFVYSAFQVYESIHRRLTLKYIIGRPMGYCFDLSMDQMLAYLLMSASSVAASRNDVWISRFGSDDFTHKANASISISFIAFFVLAICAIISTYNLFRWSF